MTAEAEFRIRSLKEADVDRLVEIAGGLRQAPQWARSVYASLVGASLVGGADGERVALVAEHGRSGLIAGFVVARIIPPEAELESIAVAEEFQRRGVARGLFSALALEVGRRGVGEILLEVREGNEAALGLYGALGFREEGRRKGYYGEPVEDAVLMRMKLT